MAGPFTRSYDGYVYTPYGVSSTEEHDHTDTPFHRVIDTRERNGKPLMAFRSLYDAQCVARFLNTMAGREMSDQEVWSAIHFKNRLNSPLP